VVLGSAALGAALVACSDAGGGADENPFAATGGTGGGAPLASAGSGGNLLPGLGGAATSPADDRLDTSGLVEPDPDETPMMVFPEAPSCAGGTPSDCQGESCCARQPVATAAELMTVAENVTVQLSAYQLDEFEVTVGRFRAFADAYDDWRGSGNPESGSGAHPYTPGSGWDKDPSWEVALPGSAAVLRVGLNCNATQQTWTDEPGFNELKPINCVSWYEAFAFCVWDEGRLPTEAEWQYAAVGGAQGRQFAWGNTPLDESFASYACAFAGSRFPSCSADDIPEVGTHPNGNGRFGQADLIGSVYEWTLDWFAPYPELMREDYAKTDMGTQRVLRGGAWNSTATEDMLATDRSFRAAPDQRSAVTGIRCARPAVDDPR
jgi:formylglycine-generating enzyme required for sulfatase activity